MEPMRETNYKSKHLRELGREYLEQKFPKGVVREKLIKLEGKCYKKKDFWMDLEEFENDWSPFGYMLSGYKVEKAKSEALRIKCVLENTENAFIKPDDITIGK